MLDCELIFDSTDKHLWSIFTGFSELERKNLLKIKYTRVKKLINEVDTKSMLKAIINGKVIYYDLKDGVGLGLESENKNMEMLKQLLIDSDYYFKRSYNAGFINKFIEIPDDIFPLGLYYPSKNNSLFFNKYVRNKPKENLKQKLKKKIYSSIFPQNQKLHFNNINELPFIRNFPPKIIFFARLWDPNKVKNDYEKNERYNINSNRIEIIRRCKEVFGENFIGGILADKYSVKFCPDIVASKRNTDKLNYIENMKNCEIGIATHGLNRSIGAKFGEYVSASRAVITQPFDITIPGSFIEDVNYLTFTDTNQLIMKLEFLLKNLDFLRNIMFNNYLYYQTNLKPDILILNTLKKVFTI